VRVTWGAENGIYTRGVSQGVLYPVNSPGVPWTGLISVTENGDDASTPLYFDGQKYRNQTVLSVFEGTLTAFTYPDEFEQYNGVVNGITAQKRLSFGLSYRNSKEIHILYNVSAAPSANQYGSISDAPDPNTFSWDITTVPMAVTEARPTSHLVISLAQAEADSISDLEALIYGDDENDPVLPDPAAILEIFESHTTLRITDNGDGTWTATGPDSVVALTDSNTFQIDWPSAVLIDADTYTVYSL
jgi:hypothetical protein